MKRKISIILCFLIALSGVFTFSLTAYGDGGEWILIDTVTYDGKENVEATNKNGIYEASSSSAPGNYSYTWRYLGDTDDYYDPDKLNGENSTSICTFTVPPPTIKGGQEVTLSLNLGFGAQMLSYYTDNASASADFDKWDVEPGFGTRDSIAFKNKDGKSHFKIDTYATVNILSVSETITATAPMGLEEGDKIALRTIFNGAQQGTSYIYEWKPVSKTGVGTTEPSGDNDNIENPEENLNVDGIEGIEDIEETENIDDTEGSGSITQIIDTEASEAAGETSASINKKIVVGIVTSIAAAAIGVAAGTGGAVIETNEGGDDEDSQGSTYKMVIYKDFGDKISMNADPVYVYARMIEINHEGVEVERPDLTNNIEIFSPDGILSIESTTLSGEYVGASVQYKGTTSNTQEGIISFRFIGEGGKFQNNVKFKLVGEASIELENSQIFILGGSGRSFELKYILENFTMEPKVTIEAVQENQLFQLELGENKKGEDIIIVRANNEIKPFETFFQSFMCEIIAENDKENVRNRFYVEVCNEGILPDFLGKPREIRGYRVSLDSEEMSETLFDVKVGLWNEEKQTLEFIKPEKVDINLSDDRNIFELIGMEVKPDENSVLTDRTRYIAKAKINFPSTNPIKGKMHISFYGEKTIENEIEISLVPDILQYERNKEKEYEACKRVIEIYMAPRFRGKKLYELEKARFNLGLEDLKEFRKKCWSIAEQSIMQEGQEYLKDAAWYDEAIATLDLVVYIGDMAFDLALAPIGGPITGFLAGEVKSAFIEVCSTLWTSPNKSLGDLSMEYAKTRLINLAGTGDGLINVPDKTKPKELVIWLICYTVYRIGYHKAFDTDDNGDSISIVEAVERGLMDFVGKGAGALLGKFIEDQGKGRWVERVSVADRDQEIVDNAVSTAMGTTLNVLDRGAAAADNIVAEALNTLMQYLEKLKITG